MNCNIKLMALKIFEWVIYPNGYYTVILFNFNILEFYSCKVNSLSTFLRNLFVGGFLPPKNTFLPVMLNIVKTSFIFLS